MKTPRNALAALLLTLGLALPAAALAKGPHHHGPPGPHPGRMVKMLERNADKLGLDAATLERIQKTVDAGADAGEALRGDVRTAHEALRTAMDADQPDKAEVLRLVERAGLARIALEQHRMAVMFDVRALLTPEQQAAIKQLRAEKRAERGEKRGKKWKKGKRGEE